MLSMYPIEIIRRAIDEWKPIHVVVAYSGGYDSMITAHIAARLQKDGLINLPLSVWAIDTKLSADGWVDYVKSTGDAIGMEVNVLDNEKGYSEYEKWVAQFGNPKTKSMHSRAYRRLKDTGFNSILKAHKTKRSDKILFLSGVRAAESKGREGLDPVFRKGTSNAIFASPIYYWTDEQCLAYRMEYDLPMNPFYETVGGSGDCQCNWGNFINIERLQEYSPVLYAERVRALDEAGKVNGGRGWGEQASLQLGFDDIEADGCSPFLCEGCSRGKSPRKGAERIAEKYFLQYGWDDVDLSIVSRETIRE